MDQIQEAVIDYLLGFPSPITTEEDLNSIVRQVGEQLRPDGSQNA